jgi:hypothetical protein
MVAQDISRVELLMVRSWCMWQTGNKTSYSINFLKLEEIKNYIIRRMVCAGANHP